MFLALYPMHLYFSTHPFVRVNSQVAYFLTNISEPVIYGDLVYKFKIHLESLVLVRLATV